MPRDEESTRISDRIRFEHIRDAARDVIDMSAGKTRQDLDSDMVLRRALVHAIQEIGEAAARMSDIGRSLAPELAWGSIVQMRHFIVHVYWGVNLDRVWVVATQHVPPLVQIAERAIEQLPLPPDIDEQ